MGRILAAVGRDDSAVRSLHDKALAGFVARFPRPDGHGLFDVIDGPRGDDATVRPSQLLAVSLPDGPLSADPDAASSVLRACGLLLTPLGLRSLSPVDPAFVSAHRGGPAERDRAYHQGTVWPWLIGPYADAARRCHRDPAPLLEGLARHVAEWGLGSVSGTTDGGAPHAATGCPFQAWSVAEVLRVTQPALPGAPSRPGA